MLTQTSALSGLSSRTVFHQDAGREITPGLAIVKKIAQLIKLSPKRSYLFNEKLAQPECCGVSIKPLRITRWTAKTIAIGAVQSFSSALFEDAYSETKLFLQGQLSRCQPLHFGLSIDTTNAMAIQLLMSFLPVSVKAGLLLFLPGCASLQ